MSLPNNFTNATLNIKKELYIEEFLESLKTRIRETDACFVIDVNSNLPTTIKNTFPNAKIQRGLSHISHNIERELKSIASITERNVIMAELNNLLFHTETYQLNQQLERFILKYCKYNYVCNAHRPSQYIWTTINSFEDCKTINYIEELNSMLESMTSQHNCFETSESLYQELMREIERYKELNSTATCRSAPANVEVNIKQILNNSHKNDLINLTIAYNKIKSISKRINK